MSFCLSQKTNKMGGNWIDNNLGSTVTICTVNNRSLALVHLKHHHELNLLCC